MANPLPALTAAGLVAYGFLRFAYALFYGPLGVKPEEVGLGYAQVLSQSMVGILLLIMLGVAALLLAVLLLPLSLRAGDHLLIQPSDRLERVIANARRDLGRGWRSRAVLLASLGREWRSWAKLAAGLVATLGVMIGLSFLTGVRAVQVIVLVIAGAVVALLILGLGKAAPRIQLPTRDEQPVAARWRRWLITVLLPLAFLFATAVVGWYITAQAQLGAVRVQQGEAWRFATLAGAPLVPLEAKRVTVRWASGTPPGGLDLGDDRCLLYLGEASGITVLYDSSARGSVRLPSSDIVISARDKDPACPNGR